MSFLRLSARISTGVAFLSLVILSIPLAFDVGGRECGLYFSLSLAVFYSLLSTARLAVPQRSATWKPARIFLRVVEVLQYPVIIPGLLLFTLSKFSDDDDGGGKSLGGGISPLTTPEVRVSNGYHNGHHYNVERKELVEKLTIGGWDTFLTFSTPMFQLAEGFCSLLVIQTGGQISRWLVNSTRSDSWMIALLVMSGSIISSSIYFLWRISQFPGIESLDAGLIGVAMTCAVFLCAYGIGSGRGNHIESSLLFSYIVLCVYQIFTDYKPSTIPTSPPPEKPDIPPFPPLVMSSYHSLINTLSEFVPTFLREIGIFVVNAYSVLTPSVIISLAYRISVFYASTRIIPAVRHSSASQLGRDPSLKDREAMSKIAAMFGWYSPTILIAVYTHLLLQHFEVVGGNGLAAGWITGVPVGGHIWRWINIAATMLLYTFELVLGDQEGNEALTSHWKTE
ncbi:ICE2-domain-containing protein [Ascodesmis nigricans]|uniref:ICE2-domain-containing protein n=1 Tax=Ascodesmis nigricans TaxID=341454 RepID=A0A4S2MV20_9PEZI|nr:ICE2-domain-containing protein [Ascodesmis nigricans]